MELFEEINRQGTTILMVTHDAAVAARAKRIVHMRDGRIERVVVKGTRAADRSG